MFLVKWPAFLRAQLGRLGLIITMFSLVVPYLLVVAVFSQHLP